MRTWKRAKPRCSITHPISPLRKVVGRIMWPIITIEVLHEVLECGHVKRIPEDIIGETVAVRRRCRKCRLDYPRDLSEEAIKEFEI